MLIVPISAPQPVRTFSGFDYVTVDAKRRRILAAHTGSDRLTVVNADSGQIVAQIKVGPMHGSAHDPVSGDIFTGNGTNRTVSKIDGRTLKVVAETKVPGPVDAIAYDPFFHRIYADEDSGNAVYVIDARTMHLTGTVSLPGHDEEYLAVDPRTHVVYQNIPGLNEVDEIDPHTLKVFKRIPTPMLRDNHPLQYDAGYDQVIVGGKNGVLVAYDPSGALIGQTAYPTGVDQCSLDRRRHELACAGNGTLSVFRLQPHGAPKFVAELQTTHDLHTVAIDSQTGYLWSVWARRNGAGDFIQRFHLVP